MLVVEHQNNKIVKVLFHDKIDYEFTNQNIVTSLILISKKYSNTILIWYQTEASPFINFNEITSLIDSDRKFISYHPTSNFFSDSIGYVEESPFININKEVCYPTWQMSGLVGATSTNTILNFDSQFFKISDFDFFLCSIAKHYMPLGLFCYSEPRLLIHKDNFQSKKASSKLLFQFVAQHYKPVWKFLLFLNLLLYKKRLSFISLINSLLSRKVFYTKELKFDDEILEIASFNEDIDVIIPTIGRKQYLYDFLCDLNHQTHLPKNVIIVEQNPQANTTSELDYLDEKWNFTIKHIFTHQTGACNARNIALKLITSKWVFFADDDIRIDLNFIDEAFFSIFKTGAKAVSYSCLQKNQTKTFTKIFQWASFGSSCSFVLTSALKDCLFNPAYEFGFGEDTDFGMQLRNKGVDIIYCPTPNILHLKAPVGGFRSKPILSWNYALIQPKPSPTIMVYNLLHLTKEQFQGYKTVLFFKYYSKQKIKNPIKYYSHTSKQWKESIFWAKKLLNES